MGELVSMAEYRQKQQRSRVSRILDIQAEQLCGQQSAPRGKKALRDEYPKSMWIDWMREDEI